MPDNQPTGFILVDLFSNIDRVPALEIGLLVALPPASVVIKAGVKMEMEMERERVESLARRSFFICSTLPLQMDETEPVFRSGRAEGV